ncbi:MAG: site-specific integrase, partial [Pseudomonadota bacterium]
DMQVLMNAKYVPKRGEIFLYERRVPLQYAAVVGRRRVRRSLRTKDPIVATQRAIELDKQYKAQWEALRAGQAPEQHEAYEVAKRVAETAGFVYKPSAEIVDPAEIMARVEALPDDPARASEAHVRGLLGSAKRRELTLSAALEYYLERTAYERAGKSPTQLRIILNGRKRVVRHLIESIGDKDVRDIDRDDLLNFFAELQARVERGEVRADTANKDLGQLRVVLNTVAELKGFPPPPLEKLVFKTPNKRVGENREVLPFTAEWIQNRILADSALDGMNEEARRVVYAMIETGMRPSEIVNILPENILLDAEVPHVRITITEQRDVKTVNAERRIPLVGVSMLAFQAQPHGFPRYFDKNPQLSAVANKRLRASGLLPSHKHTLYSLRHAFEDRLIAAGLDYRVRKNVMGHQVSDRTYGVGAELAQVRDVQARIAFRPPRSI